VDNENGTSTPWQAAHKGRSENEVTLSPSNYAEKLLAFK